jgi:hypothetical protein
MFLFPIASQSHPQLEAALARLRHSQTRLRRMQRLKVEDLEDQLGRATILLHALSELCLKKGLITSAELDAEIAALGREDEGENAPS